MKWEIGRTYQTRQGQDRKLVAITPEGRLIVEGSALSYREADGTYLSAYDGAPIPGSDLINPDEPTEEEREKMGKICEIFFFNMTARHVRNQRLFSGLGQPEPAVIKKLLKVLRNEDR